jgi:hypothetical protein
MNSACRSRMSRQCPRGQFVLNAKALPGNPYDGHNLKHATADTLAQDCDIKLFCVGCGGRT